MKVPLRWLQDYVDTGKNAREIADSFTRIGLMLDKPVGEDGVLDLEQRLNRSDLLSILGCARDLAVFENVPLHEPKIKLHKAKEPTEISTVAVRVETPAVRRFTTRVFRGVKVAASPEWLKERLELYGIESKNNIVDITNFVMLELGQPMHAQDIDRLPVPEIVIRPAAKGEKIQTLLGTEIELDSTAFVLTSGGVPQVIGGVVGGMNSGVTAETTNIVLDAGNYDPRVVRTVSRQLKIMNETVSRYDKPLDPRLTEIALHRATDLILELAGGTYYSNADYYPHVTEPQSLSLTYSRLGLISGMDIPAKAVKTVLTKLGYIITDENETGVTAEVPYYRTDVEVEDDLISDILRMRDYNTIPSASLTTPIPPDITPALYRFEEKIRDCMVSLGGHEHITTQLITGDGNPARVTLENALSEDQNALRMSALETLTAVAATYGKQGIEHAILFEIGKSFKKEGWTEIRELAVIDSRDIRETLATLLRSLAIQKYSLIENAGEVQVIIDGKVCGTLRYDACILYTDRLMEHSSDYPVILSEYTHRTVLDLSVSLPEKSRFSIVTEACRAASPSLSLIEVVEEYNEWKLVRLTWLETMKDPDSLRQKIVNHLKEQGVVTRSG